MGIGDLTQRVGSIRTPSARVVDALLASTFVAVVALDRLQNPLEGASDIAISSVLTLSVAAAIWTRRYYPMTAFVVSAVAVSAESLLGVASSVSPYGNQFLVYCVGLYATRVRSLFAPPIIVASIVVYFAGTVPGDSFGAGGVLFVWLVTWAFGHNSARRREEQERARVAIRRQVVAEEHIRMARELHDLIGHTVNLLVVQAGAARVMLDQDPAMTRNLLTGMEETGRDALADLDVVLGTLRAQSSDNSPADGGFGGRSSSPGVGQLPDLVRRLHDAQVSVTLSVDPAMTLPRSVDLSTYRIIQEALTNILKHAAPCSATVAVHRSNGSVVVEVADDGPGLARPHTPGRGLLGIAERVSSCGGVLEQGSGPSGGFALRAVLPVS